jgi:hypothetical protein
MSKRNRNPAILTLRKEAKTCFYCGRGFQNRIKVIEHFDPLSAGGRNDNSNKVISCKDSDTVKRKYEPEDFLCVLRIKLKYSYCAPFTRAELKRIMYVVENFELLN